MSDLIPVGQGQKSGNPELHPGTDPGQLEVVGGSQLEWEDSEFPTDAPNRIARLDGVRLDFCGDCPLRSGKRGGRKLLGIQFKNPGRAFRIMGYRGNFARPGKNRHIARKGPSPG